MSLLPHFDKLNALLFNPKLPDSDRPKVEEALERYKAWTAEMDAAEKNTKGKDAFLSELIEATNEYKKFIELDLIFDSKQDFLYRQKGQLKLDNTILEEFLPRLVNSRLVPGLDKIESLTHGPQECFAGLYIGPIAEPINEGGIFIKTKNQDFTVGRRLYMKVSTDKQFSPSKILDSSLNIGYFVAEIKTNLDKTMFQEAAATARELKSNVHDASYVLLCEWLDMPPIDTRMTDIDKVVILRNGKRLSSGVRSNFSSMAGRKANRTSFVKHLTDHPLSVNSFKIIVKMLNESFPDTKPLDEDTVLTRGYF